MLAFPLNYKDLASFRSGGLESGPVVPEGLSSLAIALLSEVSKGDRWGEPCGTPAADQTGQKTSDDGGGNA